MYNEHQCSLAIRLLAKWHIKHHQWVLDDLDLTVCFRSTHCLSSAHQKICDWSFLNCKSMEIRMNNTTWCLLRPIIIFISIAFCSIEIIFLFFHLSSRRNAETNTFSQGIRANYGSINQIWVYLFYMYIRFMLAGFLIYNCHWQRDVAVVVHQRCKQTQNMFLSMAIQIDERGSRQILWSRSATIWYIFLIYMNTRRVFVCVSACLNWW